ncbi:MAG: hypothetical protein V1731_00975 [Candidatus Aenigmatarchaeota archaeon]
MNAPAAAGLTIARLDGKYDRSWHYPVAEFAGWGDHIHSVVGDYVAFKGKLDQNEIAKIQERMCIPDLRLVKVEDPLNDSRFIKYVVGAIGNTENIYEGVLNSPRVLRESASKLLIELGRSTAIEALCRELYNVATALEKEANPE